MNFTDDPLGWLRQASHRGSVVVAPGARGVTRAPASNGAVAVFGADVIRTVLSDTEVFGMPVSISTRHAFPPTLANLNAAIFSMVGDSHRSRQRELARTMGPAFTAARDAAIDRGLTAYLHSLGESPEAADIRLLQSMRRLARMVAAQVVFGSGAGGEAIGVVAQQYFDLRRSYGSLARSPEPDDRANLIDVGMRLDALLRAWVRETRGAGQTDGTGVLEHLCRAEAGFSEDELVAHGNILFASSSEPIATAMTWIALALTQDHTLCARIRAESADASSLMLSGVIREVLRLVPPSAIIVRLTRARAVLAGVKLPPQTEVVISPFVEHRSANVFRDPDRLWPQRWAHVRPGAFEYLPFGGGARSCLGRRIALQTLERATAALLDTFDVFLPYPQRLDWRMNTTLQPATEPLVRFAPAGTHPCEGSALSGPAAELLNTARIQ